MAYFVAYADIRGKKFIHYALLLPLVIPGYIITLAWMQFFAKSGFVASLVQSVMPGAAMPNIYSYWGIIFVFSVTKYPLDLHTLTLSTFRKISTDMELAAAISGCNKVKTFFKVTLPMSLSGVANGLLLVFISCLIISALWPSWESRPGSPCCPLIFIRPSSPSPETASARLLRNPLSWV